MLFFQYMILNPFFLLSKFLFHLTVCPCQISDLYYRHNNTTWQEYHLPSIGPQKTVSGPGLHSPKLCHIFWCQVDKDMETKLVKTDKAFCWLCKCIWCNAKIRAYKAILQSTLLWHLILGHILTLSMPTWAFPSLLFLQHSVCTGIWQCHKHWSYVSKS